MASLTGKLVAETYKALLKTIDNDILTASEKQITDGFGGGSNVFIDSQGFLRANKYKVTNGLATQFLKADGSLDSNTYLTGITSSQIITALGYIPVTNARTLTINGTTYDLSANRSWTISGTAAVWGNISGTLSNQTDLQNALNAKFNNPSGTISQYIRGDGTLATLPSAAVWGNITGTLSAQTDLQSALDAKFDDPTGNSTQYIDGSGNLQTFPTMLSSDNLIKLVRNQSGATMTAGTIVYINGATGNKPTIAKALATSDATSAQTYGMVQADISNNADGYIVVIGNVNNLNTHSLTEGAQLYLSATTAGTWTTTKQYAPNHLVYVGIVLRSHPNQGIIGVKIQNGYEMDELHDVSAQSPTNNDGLFFETSTGLWKNKSIATALGYTPQAQLSGTGFVKALGTTISYDNSTYLTTTDAASTYQRLDKMVSNLLASATEYPNSNAVINALALKADALNPVFTGYMTISGAEPKLYFTDTDQNPDYFIGADAGFFRIYDQTAGATRFVINSSGVTTIAGDLIVGTIAKSGGTATQFLKADGSIDSSTYVTSASLANYLLISTAASTYQRLDKMVSNLLASDTEYPNSNAVLAKLALKADAANPVFTGDMTISGIAPKLYFTDTDNNPDYTLFVDSGYFYIYDQTAGATKFQITPSGNAINTGTLTSASFIKSGGTSSQYLMADGSVSTLANPVTGSGTTNYLPKWTSGSALGNSVIYDNGTNIAIRSTNAYSPLNVQGYGIAWGENQTYFASSSGYITLAFWLQGATDYTGTWAIGKQSRTVEASVEYLQIAKNGLTGSALHRADALQTWDPNGNSYFGFRVGVGTITPSAKLSLGMGVGAKLLVYDNPTTGVYSGLGQDLAAGDSIDLFAHGLSGIGFITFGQLATNKTTYTEWARFRTNGWFGIGTTSPDARLHVQSPTVSYGQIRFLNSSTDGEATINIGRTNQGVDSRWTFGQGPAGIGDGFGFYTNGSNKFTLSTSGDAYFLGSGTFNNSVTINKNNGYLLLNRTATTSFLGISHRTSMAAKWFVGLRENSTDNYIIYNETTGLDVFTLNVSNGAATFIGGVGGVNFTNSTTITNTASSGYTAMYANGGGLYWGGVASTNQMHLNSSGYLGIGTTSQLYPLDVVTSGGIVARFTGNSGAYIILQSNGVRNWWIANGINSGNDGWFGLYNATAGVNAFIISGSSNNVLIGTTTDLGANKLQVNGNIQFGTWTTAASRYLGYSRNDNGAFGVDGSSGIEIESVSVVGNYSQNLHFWTHYYNNGSGRRMTISYNGNVGIGNTPLQAVGTTLTVGGSLISNPAASGGNYNENFRANRAGNGYSAIAMGGAYGSTSGTGAGIWTLAATPAGVSYAFDFDYAGATVIRISTGGNITATAFFESSDMRLKKLIDGSAQISGIENLEAKLYEKNGKLEFGYFAQDAEKLMPYAVEKNADGFLTLSYREVHTAKIARLEKRVAELEKQLNLN